MVRRDNVHTNASEAFLGYSGREEPEGPSNEVEVVRNPQLSDYRGTIELVRFDETQWRLPILSPSTCLCLVLAHWMHKHTVFQMGRKRVKKRIIYSQFCATFRRRGQSFVVIHDHYHSSEKKHE